MSVKHNFKSDAFQVIHESAEMFFNLGLMSQATLRAFDAECLTPDSLAEMIAQCDMNALPPADLRSWDEMLPVGKELL